jgi:S-adenosylmethionine-diacylglycerol 3-amino-3-carboxypropyl transferase
LFRTKHALTALDTSQNPYLHYILNGEYTTVFPYSLREENYDNIRNNLDKIEFHKQSIEQFTAEFDGRINAFNFSNIFEYMTQDGMDKLYETILQKASAGTRFAYWNMIVPRKCSDTLCKKYGVETNEKQNEQYLLKDKAFFYNKFYLDKIK